MRDTSGKIENGGLTPQGQLGADEHNDVIEDLVDNVERSGQTIEAANTSQTSEASTLASWIAPTMEVGSGSTPDDLRLVPILGATGFKMPAPNPGVYDRLNGARIIFKAIATNTGTVTVNIGQTIAALLGTKKLLDFAGNELVAGVIVDTNLIECIYLSALDGGTGAWQLTRSAIVQSDWDQTDSLQPDFIKNKPVTQLVPVGAVMPWPTEAPPTNWLECNGQEISRTGIYANLFSVIGTRYGLGDGSTTFNLPDYRGYFLRSWDNEAENDPGIIYRTGNTTSGSIDITGITPSISGVITVGMSVVGPGIPAGATITNILSASSIRMSIAATATATGVDIVFSDRTDRGDGAVGNAVGTFQDENFKSHRHSFGVRLNHSNHASGDPHTGNDANSSRNTNFTGGLETRPKNISVMYIIHY